MIEVRKVLSVLADRFEFLEEYEDERTVMVLNSTALILINDLDTTQDEKNILKAEFYYLLERAVRRRDETREKHIAAMRANKANSIVSDFYSSRILEQLSERPLPLSILASSASKTVTLSKFEMER